MAIAAIERLREVLHVYGISGPLFISVVVVILSIGIYANFIHEDPDFKRNRPPPAIKPATEVVSLRIYPIKSCRGIELKESNLKTTGLDLDRNWMFVDPTDNKFLTIRSDATMTLIHTAVDWKKDELTISIDKTNTSVTVQSRPSKEWLEANTKLEQVEIWGEKTDAWVYGPDINDKFKSHFEKPVKLVYKGPTARNARGNGAPSLYGKEVPHHFADVLSLQVANESSIADLNAKLKERGYDGEELTIERFRPNIVVRGGQAWEEDSWKEVRITTVDHEKELLWQAPLDVVARCARCHVPNVNPETAETHDKEPWGTLMKYRRVDHGGAAKWKPCFGVLALPKLTYPIPVRVGSKFEILSTTDKHVYSEAKFKDL